MALLQQQQARLQAEVAQLGEAKDQLSKRHEKALDSLINTEGENARLKQQVGSGGVGPGRWAGRGWPGLLGAPGPRAGPARLHGLCVRAPAPRHTHTTTHHPPRTPPPTSQAAEVYAKYKAAAEQAAKERAEKENYSKQGMQLLGKYNDKKATVAQVGLAALRGTLLRRRTLVALWGTAASPQLSAQMLPAPPVLAALWECEQSDQPAVAWTALAPRADAPGKPLTTLALTALTAPRCPPCPACAQLMAELEAKKKEVTELYTMCDQLLKEREPGKQ